MRTPWMYRAGALFALFAGLVAVSVDASFSLDWIQLNIPTDSDTEKLLAFVLCVLASSFGALVTNPQSWALLFTGTQALARIQDENQRLLTMLGSGLTVLFMFAIFVAVYGTDLISNYSQTGSWFASVFICFASDACFMMVPFLWNLGRAATLRIQELEDAFYRGGSSTSADNKDNTTQKKKVYRRGGRFN
ncbi:MAG: hypothetical protein F6K09_00965 [Merismopedia sp. SIO2A8]|nr:hypothetical protein [Symploca sp. SIO2B6]NET47302.1 hypothetical protein [Merismopedia sp. SIO2A8]